MSTDTEFLSFIVISSHKTCCLRSAKHGARKRNADEHNENKRENEHTPSHTS